MATTTAATTAFAILALPSEDKFWFVHKFCEDIAHGKGMARPEGLPIWKFRRVVHHKRAVEPHIAIGLHHLDHIHVALINEDLLKITRRAAHIAKVDIDDFAQRTNVADGLLDIDAHLRHAALAE